MVTSSSKETHPTTARLEVESVTCDSCGFTEECTPGYIQRIRSRYEGRWICGLCMEAVKDELKRSPTQISTEEALHRHTSFHSSFRSIRGETEEHPISVMGRILRRSLDGSSPRKAVRRNSSGSLLGGMESVNDKGMLVRSESCFPSLSR